MHATSEPKSRKKLLHAVDALSTTGARAVVPFMIDDSQYLAVPQLAADIEGKPADMTKGNMDVETLVFKEQGNRMQLYQRIQSSGGEDAEFFSIGHRKFLAIASLRRGCDPYDFAVNSTINEWRDSKFVPFQEIPTFAAKQWRYFNIGDRHFLALAQGVGHGMAENLHKSEIFEWDGSSFIHFQDVPSAWGYNWHFFTLDGQYFLAYADNVAPSIILRWNGTEFQHFQTLDGKSGRAFCFFQAQGSSYLAFANLMGSTLLYRWDQGQFNVHQTLSGPGGREFALLQMDGETYVVQANFLTGSREAPKTNLESVIYRLQSGQLSVAETFSTLGATDVKPLKVGGNTCLVISESLSADVRFRTDSHIYQFSPEKGKSQPAWTPVYQNPEFLALFNTYTGGPNSIGADYVRIAAKARQHDPLIVATATDMALFPGGGQPPSFQPFRLSTKGFKELAAVSHLGPALGSLVAMRSQDPTGQLWREDAEKLLKATEATRNVNSAKLWSQKIAVEAYRGREEAIAAMIDYACVITIRFLHTVLENPAKLTPEFLRAAYLEGVDDSLGASIPLNNMMIATFFLAGMDIAHRVTRWFKEQEVDWSRAMVLICGRQGRPTSGVTFSSNSICQIIYGASNLLLPREHIYIAPHAPSFRVADLKTIEEMHGFEEPMRTLWCHTRATADLGPLMFKNYPRYAPGGDETPVVNASTATVTEMPRVLNPDDMFTMTTRMRLVMEDERQLLSGCVTDYAVAQLRATANDPTKVVVPGLDKYQYPVGLRIRDYSSQRSPSDCNGIHRPEGSEADVAAVDHPSPHLDFIDTDFAPTYQTLNVEGGQIAWWEDGTGNQPVLWVHGLPLESRAWEAQRRHFSRHSRNIFLDLRGYGRSSKLPLPIHNVTALYCRDIVTLLNHLRLDNVALIGFASAGHIAFRLAAQLGTRISKLVSINGSPKFRSSPDWPWGFDEAAIAHFTDTLANEGLPAMTDLLLAPQATLRDVSAADAQRLVAWWTPMSMAAGADTLLGFFDSISLDDDRELLKQITAETLLLSGAMGQEVSSAVALYLRQQIPRARLVELAGAGHFAFATRSAVVNKVIEDFLFGK